MKKKRINIGTRQGNSFLNEKELEDNIKIEIAKEINATKKPRP